jgi:hypothetical protein
VRAWEACRNASHKQVDWQFTADDARFHLKQLYENYRDPYSGKTIAAVHLRSVVNGRIASVWRARFALHEPSTVAGFASDDVPGRDLGAYAQPDESQMVGILGDA